MTNEQIIKAAEKAKEANDASIEARKMAHGMQFEVHGMQVSLQDMIDVAQKSSVATSTFKEDEECVVLVMKKGWRAPLAWDSKCKSAVASL